MRIISGTLGGRRISIGKLTGIRPTTDRVRESLFNILIHAVDFHGSRVLDICAGSGILGFEAISRGAESCTFIEKNRRTATLLEKHSEELGIGVQTQVLTMDFQRGIQHCAEKLSLPENSPFDIIFCDPPYHLQCLSSILEKIAGHALLDDEGIFVGEHAPSENIHIPSSMELLQQKHYGDTVIEIIQKHPS